MIVTYPHFYSPVTKPSGSAAAHTNHEKIRSKSNDSFKKVSWSFYNSKIKCENFSLMLKLDLAPAVKCGKKEKLANSLKC